MANHAIQPLATKMTNKTKTDWLGRLATTQFLLMYPIQTAMLYPNKDGWAQYVSVGFIFSGWLLLNYIFVKDLLSIFNTSKHISELYKEYIWVLVMALMNISLFASIYHMFGIVNSGELIKGDWYLSFYFSIVTWTTLGYGDFAPSENIRLVAAIEAMIGYFYMAILVGLLLNISQHTMRPKIAKKTVPESNIR